MAKNRNREEEPKPQAAAEIKPREQTPETMPQEPKSQAPANLKKFGKFKKGQKTL